jgi:hypothetical protein
MSRFALALASALAAGTLAGALTRPAFAETPLPAGVFIAAQTQNEYLAKDQLIGAKVQDATGRIVGDIEDLILDEHNTVIGVVMGTGGFLGVAEKKVGVHLSALDFEEKDGKTIVALPEATAANLEAAPVFQRTKPKKTIMERAKEKARELSDKAKSTTEQAIEKAKPQLDAAKEKAMEAYEKAKEAAGPALEQAKQAAEEAKQAVKEGLEAAKEAAGEMSKELAPAEPAPAPAPESAPAPEAAPAKPEPL